MKNIIDSIINGQRTQAIKQLSSNGYDFSQLLEELYELEMHEEVVVMYNIAVHVGMIVEVD